MPIDFLSGINLGGSQLQNAVIQPLATDPQSAEPGQVYYNTSGQLRFYNGSSWQILAQSTGQSTITGVTGGQGISSITSGGVVTISHADTSSVANSTNTGATVLQSITFDGFGHVQTISTKQITLSDLGYTGATDADKYIGFTIDANSGVTSNIGPEGVITLSGDGIDTIASGASIEFVNTDKGSAQDIFKNIAADTGTNSVASSNSDTLTLAGGDGLNTVSTPASDTITFSVDSTVVRTTGNQTIAGDKTFSGNVAVFGSFTVSGAVTTTVSETVNVEDSVMYLNSNAPTTPVDDSGFIVNRGGQDNVGIIWDESQDEFAAIQTTSDAQTQGDVPIGAYANFRALGIYSQKVFLSNLTAGSADYDKFLAVDGTEVKTRTGAQLRSDIGAGTVSSVSISASGPLQASGTVTSSGSISLSINDASTSGKGVVTLASGSDALGMDSGDTKVVTVAALSATRVQANIGDGAATSFLIEHNMDTRDVIVQIYDRSTYDTVYTDVSRASLSEVLVSFSSAPALDAYRVLIIRA